MLKKKKYLHVFLALALGLSVSTGCVPAAFAEPALKEQAVASKGRGTEDRQWVTGASTPQISTERYPVTVQEDVSIAMSDGILLKGRLFLPEVPGGRLPSILLANGYGHINQKAEDDLSRYLAERGYAVLHVGLRGSGTSEGVNNLYNMYGQDSYELVEWMAKQSWSDGKVGMVGQSLRGITQWLTAKQLPPSLKAISPEIACADCYNYLWYPGGMLPGPGRVGRGEPEYSSAKEHRNFDDWWRERTVSTEDMKAIIDHGISALLSGGWNDYITPGNVQAFKEFSALGGNSKLIIGPEAHSSIKALLPYDFKDYQVLGSIITSGARITGSTKRIECLSMYKDQTSGDMRKPGRFLTLV